MPFGYPAAALGGVHCVVGLFDEAGRRSGVVGQMGPQRGGPARHKALDAAGYGVVRKPFMLLQSQDFAESVAPLGFVFNR